MFTRLLRRNLIMMLLPILVMEALIIFMVMQLGLLPEYSSKRVNNITSVDTLYKEGVKNISFVYDASSLNDQIPQYAGFDETVSGERVAGYYYIFEGDVIRLLVLSDETEKRLSSGEKITIDASIEKDEVKARYIEGALSERLDMDGSVFEGFVQPVVINETTFPRLKLAITNHAIGVFVIIVIVTVLYGITAFVCPWLIFGLNKKGIAKSRSELIDMMNEELGERLEEKSGNEYTTENYTIYAYISHIEIIKR